MQLVNVRLQLSATVCLSMLLGAAAGSSSRLKSSQAYLEDLAALLTLKQSITDSGSSEISSWIEGGHPCIPDAWPHLTCKGERVTKLDLSEQDVAGTLPASLGRLTSLIELRLGGNRLTGELPEAWGSPLYFKRLSVLDLNGNQLSGLLPSKAWNKKQAWRSLTVLDLSSNAFYGGLPAGWLSTNRIFGKRLQRLDLSNNFLGYSNEGEALLQGQQAWCGTEGSSGWCSATPLLGTATNLRELDVSYNDLTGQLPKAWARMFPKLQTLRLQGNNLWAQPEGQAIPSALPIAWTTGEKPVAFPQLQTLTLYPGNSLICSLPDFLDGGAGYLDVNTDGTYLIEDEDDPENDIAAENPHPCPGPAGDNPPSITSITVESASNSLRLEWAAPSQESQLVAGYKVSLFRFTPESDEWLMARSWSGRFFRTFLDESFGTLPKGLGSSVAYKSGGGSGSFRLDTGFTGLKVGGSAAGRYLAEISSFNLDGSHSSVDSMEAELDFH